MRKTRLHETRVAPAATSDRRVASERSWIPATGLSRAVLDPAHWSERARQERYWRMVEIWNRQRALH